MRSFSRPSRIALAVCALLAPLAACEGEGVVVPPDPVVVEIVPDSAVLLGIGDTATVRAVVRNASDTSVVFQTSNPSVATVSGAGVVTGVARGVATISARSAQDPGAQDAVLARVVDASTIPVTSGRPAVSIESLVDEAGRLVSPDSARGMVVARLSVERGTSTRLEVLLDGTLACTLDFPTGVVTSSRGPGRSMSPVTLACPINTARFDPTTGAPTFSNGPAVLSARLLGAGDSTVAGAGAVGLTLANANTVVTTLVAAEEAEDGGGEVWLDGDVTVTALPVLYDAGLRTAEVTFAPTGSAAAQAVVDSVAPYEAVFREDVELRGVVDDSLRVVATATTPAGHPAARAVAGPVRYDNEAPAPGTLSARDWVGAEVAFASLYDPAGERDLGVGRVTPRFFAGEPGTAAAELVAGGEEVRTGSDLAESAAEAYAVAALACDALGNCSVGEGFEFGVDLDPPTIAGYNIVDPAANPGQDLAVLGIDDDLSGIGPRPLRVAVSALSGDSPAPACGPVVEGTDLPGTPAEGSCEADTAGLVVDVPRSRAGYYTYTVTPVDRAGNRGATDTLEILVDVAPPTVSLITLPAQLVGGNPLTLAAQAQDNLDLVDLSAFLVFPRPGGGRLALPFAVDTVGAPFDGGLDPQASSTLRIPLFARSLTYSTATGDSSGRVTVLVDSVQVHATDAAGQVTRAGERVLPSMLTSTSTADPFAPLSGVQPALSTVQFCTANCLPSDPDATVFTLRITGESGSGAPFARLYFFRRDAAGGVRLVGAVGEATTTSDVGGQRVFTFEFPYRPEAGLEGDYALFAVGVTSTGVALKSEDVAISFFHRP